MKLSDKMNYLPYNVLITVNIYLLLVADICQ
jgi:hypothetical protein